MPRKNISFENASGQTLAGILDSPSGAVRAYALFAHCFTCSKNLKAVANISRALTDAGIAVFRFDFTGLGQSEGDFADSNFSANIADLLSAARILEREFDAPALLIGHSLGGTAVLRAARDIGSAVAIVTIGSPAHPSHVAATLTSSRDEIEQKGEAIVELGGRPFTVRKQFLTDIEEHPPLDDIAALRKALLIMHAPLDDVVEIENAGELFGKAKHPKSFVSLDQADHLLTRNEDSRYVGGVIAAWAARYLPLQETPELDGAADEVVARTPAGGFRSDLLAAGHALVADEPVSYGGTNIGPSPYDLLSAALASCTSMTLQVYARHKKIPLAAATVRVRHDKIHARDCEECETQEGKVDRFERRIELDGELDDEQRKRMLEIADRCPVHRTLHREISIVSALEERR